METVVPADCIFEFKSADEFWRSQVKAEVDILLLDISMPDMNGIDLLDLISEKKLKLKTIVLSNLASEDTILNALKKGAFGYVWKSEMEYLVQAISIVVSGGAMISPTIAVKLMQSFRKQPVDNPDYTEKLTVREKQVLEILSTGETCEKAAEIINVAVSTLRTHIRNIYEKLHVNNRTAMLKKASDMGII
jgi:DNA-binding NarL/FixJ family response regulator